MIEWLRSLFQPAPEPPQIEPEPKPEPERCCDNPENLVRSHYGPDKVMDMCKICGRRHFRFTAEPGKIGVTLTPPGGAPEEK